MTLPEVRTTSVMSEVLPYLAVPSPSSSPARFPRSHRYLVTGPPPRPFWVRRHAWNSRSVSTNC